MPDLPLETSPGLCAVCGVSPAFQGNDWCQDCVFEVFRLFCLTVGETVRRLAPEAWALLVVLFFAPTFGIWVLMLLIPVLVLAAGRGLVIFRRQFVLIAGELLDRSILVRQAQQYLIGIQSGKSEVRADLRREVEARGIPLSGELEEALRGSAAGVNYRTPITMPCNPRSRP